MAFCNWSSPHVSHFCLLFLASLFFYHPKSIWKYIFTTSILILLSFLLVGWDGIRQFIEILRISANGAWYGMNEDAMLNLIGILSRILPFISDEIIRIIGWAGYLIAIIFSIVFWKKKRSTIRRADQYIYYPSFILCTTLTLP